MMYASCGAAEGYRRFRLARRAAVAGALLAALFAIAAAGPAYAGPSIKVAASLNVGSAAVGSSRTQNLRIQNVGNATLTGKLGKLSAPFSLSPGASCGLSIPAGNTVQVPIEFKPVKVGTATETLTITSNDPKHKKVSVKLSGQGTQGSVISGTVGGGVLGSTPVSGASVFVLEAGGAYGSGVAQLGVSTSDSAGHFSTTFTAPATPGELYVTALSGSVAGVSINPQIGLMALVGLSNKMSSTIVVDPFTTVAAEWALAQFSGGVGTEFGAPASNSVALKNAISQAMTDLAESNNGGPAPFLPTVAQCASSSPPVNCNALERLNTLAAIVSQCVESSAGSAACNELSSDAGLAPGNMTLADVHAIVTHPKSSVAAIYGLLSSPNAFAPTLPSAPDGWELSLEFFGTSPGLNGPAGIALDALGNVWTADFGDSSVAELTAGSSYSTELNFNNSSKPGANFDGPGFINVNTSNNVWVSNLLGSTITELYPLNCGLGVTNWTNQNIAGNNGFPGPELSTPEGMAMDEYDDVWLANSGNNSVGLLIGGFCSPASGCIGANYNSSNTGPFGGAGFSSPEWMAVDTEDNVWATNLDNDSVSELTASSLHATARNFNNQNTGQFGGAGLSEPAGIAPDAAGDIWVANQGNNSVSELVANNSQAANLNNVNSPGAAFNTPFSVAVDSAGNVWVTNESDNSLTELPAGNFSAGAVNFAPHAVGQEQWIAIDSAGNIWTSASGRNYVTEVFGLAAPTMTPIQACLIFETNNPGQTCLP